MVKDDIKHTKEDLKCKETWSLRKRAPHSAVSEVYHPSAGTRKLNFVFLSINQLCCISKSFLREKWEFSLEKGLIYYILHSNVLSIFFRLQDFRNNLVFSKCTFSYEKNHSQEIASHILRQLYNHKIKTWRITLLLKKLKARGKETVPYYNVGILALEGSVGPFTAYWWRPACANHPLDTQKGNVGLCSRLYNLSDARFSLRKTSWQIKFKLQYRGLASEEEWCTGRGECMKLNATASCEPWLMGSDL